uniref:F-box n=1 Tax=Musca domestica TaxID=7370 RepID=T1PGE2_MUSDO
MYDVGFEQILQNCDIAIYLYQFLNFSDQLRLSRVNRQLQNIFEQLIWKEKYQTMTITEDEDGNYVVMGAIRTSPLILEYDEFREFIDAYAHNVRELCVKDLRALEIQDVMWEFPNLVKLQYERVQMPMTHLTWLSRKCRNLEELQLLRCSYGTAWNVEIGKMPSVKLLAKIRKLKRLSVQNSGNHNITFEIFQQVVRRLKLEEFKFDNFIQAEVYKAPKPRKPGVQLKELDIEVSLDPEKWLPRAYAMFLANFEHLQTLTIYFTYRVQGVNEAALLALARTCRNLETMKISCSNFHNIQDFHLPPNLKELTLHSCKNLSCDNLRQLLCNAQSQISKFTSTDTLYEGQLPELDISPSIEILNIDSVSSIKFRSLHHLKELTWYDDYPSPYILASSGNSLKSCISLQSLHIKSGILPMDWIVNLENLHTISIGESMYNIDWSYFASLLRHPTLRNLSVEDQRYRSLLCERSDPPAEEIVTQLTSLKISLPTFRKALDFWLHLLETNVQLTLTCNHFIHFEEFLHQLLDNENFPSNLRNIEIWDIPLNCSKLRRSFDHMMNKFMFDVSFIRSEYKFDGDLYCLRLQR